MKADVICQECGKVFQVINYRAITGKAKYCSLECKYKNMNYKVKKGTEALCLNCEKKFYVYPSRAKKAEFKFCSVECRTIANKGLFLQENNWNWKGQDVSYQALHTWVSKYGPPKQNCTICGSDKNLQWSNKNHLYRRNLLDWWVLCTKCHCRYDITFNNKKS